MNANRLRTSIAAAMGGAVLLAGLLVGASFALAQETDEPEITVEGDSPDRSFRSFRGDARMMGGDLDGIAEELGTTLEELRDQLAAGATLDDIAATFGVDLDAVFDELHQKAIDAIDQRVEDGDLTEEQADAMKERMESFDRQSALPFGSRDFRRDMPEGSMDDRHPFDGMRGFGNIGGFLGELDLDLAELGDLLRSGASIDEALDSMGLDLDNVVADATAAALAHLDELVAEGTMTQDEADHIKEMIENFDLSQGFPFGLRDMNFDFGFDMENFNMDRFRGHAEDHFGFFSGDCTEDKNADEALLDV